MSRCLESSQSALILSLHTASVVVTRSDSPRHTHGVMNVQVLTAMLIYNHNHSLRFFFFLDLNQTYLN